MPQPPANQPAPRPHIPYRIVGQEETEELMPTGHFEQAFRVMFQGPAGVTSTVIVPTDQYSAAIVDQMIQDKLYHVEEVHNLGSGPYQGGSV